MSLLNKCEAPLHLSCQKWDEFLVIIKTVLVIDSRCVLCECQYVNNKSLDSNYIGLPSQLFQELHMLIDGPIRAISVSPCGNLSHFFFLVNVLISVRDDEQ